MELGSKLKSAAKAVAAPVAAAIPAPVKSVLNNPVINPVGTIGTKLAVNTGAKAADVLGGMGGVITGGAFNPNGSLTGSGQDNLFRMPSVGGFKQSLGDATGGLIPGLSGTSGSIYSGLIPGFGGSSSGGAGGVGGGLPGTGMEMLAPDQPLSKYETMLGNYATAQGPSQQAKYLMEQGRLEESGLLDKLGRQGQGQAMQNLNLLAMRGGAQGGSRMNLLKNAQQQAMLGGQDIRSQAAGSRLGTLAADEGTKLGLQQKLADLANQRYGFNQQVNAAQKSANAQMGIANQPGMFEKIFNMGGLNIV